MNTEVKFKSLVELTKYFSDEKKCVEHLELLRWNGQRGCPHCGSVKTYVCKGLGKYKCGDCKQRFSVLTKTFFEATKIPLSKWFIAMYLCLGHKKGVSSHQLARDLQVTQKTAWFILHRLRVLVKDKAPAMLDGMVEGDESFFGGKERNKSNKKRKELQQKSKLTGSTWHDEKHVVAGLLQRDGKIVLKHVPNATHHHLTPFVHTHIAKGAKFYTDEHSGYAYVQGYQRGVVNHAAKQYTNGSIHSNTIEGAWSLFKRSVYGIHHSISRKHLQKYAVAFAFRYNTRKLTEQQRFDIALSQCADGRLTYWDLIKNDSNVSIFERNEQLFGNNKK